MLEAKVAAAEDVAQRTAKRRNLGVNVRRFAKLRFEAAVAGQKVSAARQAELEEQAAALAARRRGRPLSRGPSRLGTPQSSPAAARAAAAGKKKEGVF